MIALTLSDMQQRQLRADIVALRESRRTTPSQRDDLVHRVLVTLGMVPLGNLTRVKGLIPDMCGFRTMGEHMAEVRDGDVVAITKDNAPQILRRIADHLDGFGVMQATPGDIRRVAEALEDEP